MSNEEHKQQLMLSTKRLIGKIEEITNKAFADIDNKAGLLSTSRMNVEISLRPAPIMEKDISEPVSADVISFNPVLEFYDQYLSMLKAIQKQIEAGAPVYTVPKAKVAATHTPEVSISPTVTSEQVGLGKIEIPSPPTDDQTRPIFTVKDDWMKMRIVDQDVTTQYANTWGAAPKHSIPDQDVLDQIAAVCNEDGLYAVRINDDGTETYLKPAGEIGWCDFESDNFSGMFLADEKGNLIRNYPMTQWLAQVRHTSIGLCAKPSDDGLVKSKSLKNMFLKDGSLDMYKVAERAARLADHVNPHTPGPNDQITEHPSNKE